MSLPRMNSNKNDVGGSDGKNTHGFTERQERLQRILRQNTSITSEDYDGQESVKGRKPVHRSFTDVQTKIESSLRFRTNFADHKSEITPSSKFAAKPNNEGDDCDSTEDIVDQLIEKLRDEKISSAPLKRQGKQSWEYSSVPAPGEALSKQPADTGGLKVAEVNKVLETVKNKPLQKLRKRSFRTFFSWISEEEEPVKLSPEIENKNFFTFRSMKSPSPLDYIDERRKSSLNSSPPFDSHDARRKSCPSFGVAKIRTPNYELSYKNTGIEHGVSALAIASPLAGDHEHPSPSFEHVPVANNSPTPSYEASSPDEIIRPILDELITTEESYVDILWNGIRNYYHIFERPDLPFELQGREYELFANIQDIAKFHRDELLPMLRESRESAKILFEKLQQFVEDKKFHIYLLYTINKKRSMQLCANHKGYFQGLQTEFGDRLGICSFLLQPIQRMPRYPLLLTEVIKSLYKHKRCPLLTVCCQLEHKMRNLLHTINASECINDIKGIDMTQLFSTFRRFAEFQVYDHTRRNRYMGKLFLFDATLIVTEIQAQQLQFRVQYSADHLELTKTDEGFTLDYKGSGWDDCKCDFVGRTMQVNKWIDLIEDIIPKTPCTAEVPAKEIYFPCNHREVAIFDVYDHSLARSYRCKIFLFEKCLTLAELQGDVMLYRGIYPFDQLGVLPFEKYFTLFRHRRFQQECDFRGHHLDVQEWSELLRDLAAVNLRRAGSLRRKFGNAISGFSPKTV